MGKVFHKATERAALFDAWRKIRSNGLKSRLAETRSAVEAFEQKADRNIRRIQKALRADTFEFEPQRGVLLTKSSGGKRGVVIASVYNRIVERAILDALQTHSQFIKNVNSIRTSIGGVPQRSVPHGLAMVRNAYDSGRRYFVRSDISGFFDNIPRLQVIDRIAADIDDQRFIELMKKATTVTLANESALGEDRSVFPTDEEGVAQGSPLSPLFGNVLLYDFDGSFNGRGITCVRFIDDFIMLGEQERYVRKAFANARKHLSDLGLTCHDPFAPGTPEEKASYGGISDGCVFLGYDIYPGLLQPSAKARKNIKDTVDDHLRAGRKAIKDVQRAEDSFASRQRYVQTLAHIDRVLRGWGDAFAYANAPGTMDDIDLEIDGKLTRFRQWFARQTEKDDWKMRRRTGGVCLLSDIKPKSLDEVPFTLEEAKRFRTTSRTVTISTDGSALTDGGRRGRDRGPGGWAFVVHESGEEVAGGTESATNNEMELAAVIAALKHFPEARSIKIHTDSQYISQAVNEQNTIKSNHALWEEYKALTQGRSVKIVWVKGHANDRHNERADVLARQAAREIVKPPSEAAG